MRLLYVAALAAVSGCAPYVEIGGGYRRVNGDDGLVGCFAAGNEFTDRTYLEYRHCSDPTKGRPVNDDYDVSHDVLTINHRWGGKHK